MSEPDRLVFLSYPKPSRPVADAIAERFEKRKQDLGLNVGLWYDQQLNGGDQWDDEIRGQLNRADIALFLVTKPSLKARYMWDEEFAVAKARLPRFRIIPLLYSDVDAPIFRDIATKTLHRLPAAAVDELGEARWLTLVIDGVFRSINSSLAQERETPDERFRRTVTEAKGDLRKLHEQFRGMKAAVFGSLRGEEILEAFEGCELALTIDNPCEVATDLESWRRRLTQSRVLLDASVPILASRISDFVHQIEAIQTWARFEQMPSPHDQLAPARYLPADCEARIVKEAQENASSQRELLQRIVNEGAPDAWEAARADFAKRGDQFLSQTSRQLAFSEIDVSAVKDNVSGLQKRQNAYFETFKELGAPAASPEVEHDIRLRTKALVKVAGELNEAYARHSTSSAGVTLADGRKLSLDQLHSLPAEKAILAPMMLNNNVYARVSSALQANHFYSPANAAIFESIERAILKGQLADEALLGVQLLGDRRLSEVGGIAYIANIINSAVPDSEIAHHIRVVRRLALRRELVGFASTIMTKASDTAEEDHSDELFESVEQEFYSLTQRNVERSDVKDFNSALADSLGTPTKVMHRDGALTGVSTGLIDLDRMLGGLRKSEVILLAARPSMGKVALATSIAYHAAKACKRVERADGSTITVEGAIVGFVSLEMSSDQLATRVLADVTEVRSDRIRRGELTPRDVEGIRDTVKIIEDLPLYVLDGSGASTIERVSAVARRLQRTSGLDLLVVDNLQMLTMGASHGSLGVVDHAAVLGALKRLAVLLDIPVLVLSQLSRDIEDRDDKQPRLHDLREFGMLERHADVVMFLYREAYYLEREEPAENDEEARDAWAEVMRAEFKEAQIIIAKQRHGPIGTVNVAFDPIRVRFSNLQRRYENGYQESPPTGSNLATDDDRRDNHDGGNFDDEIPF